MSTHSKEVIPDRERIAEHIAYLQRMATDGVVPSSLANKARLVWWVARASAGGPLPIPAAAAFPGGPFEYHWSVGPHRVSVEIPADGPCHWFYRDTTTEEIWGADLPSDDGLPACLEGYLHRLVASDR